MKTKLLIISLLLITGMYSASGQTLEITGRVISSEDMLPVPGVSVVISGTTSGTATDTDGYYSISASAGDILVFSFIGLESVEHRVTTGGELNITMNPEVQAIDELIVIGYGVQKKSLVTGAISSIGEKDINRGSNLRFEQALQGKTAGVLIMNNSGQPGDNYSIRIRGTSTPNGAQPLVIVDGVPVGGMDYLNPGDISSIEVLKDAASSAIYGTRGANGVILVTTKQGTRRQEATVSYDVYYGLQNPWKKMDLLNAREYGAILNEAYYNDSRPLPISNEELIKFQEGTDWQEEVFYRNAPVLNHQVSVSGGTENSTYASSFSYFSQDGIVAKGKSNFERYTFRLNSNHSLYDSRFNFGQTLAYTHITRRGINPNGEWGSPLGRAINLDPLTPVKNEDGSWGTSDFASQEIVNPVAALSYINSKSQVDKVVGNVYGEYELLKDLKFKSSFSIDLAFGTDDNYVPEYYITSNIKNDVPSVSKGINKWFTWNYENTLSYNKSWGNSTFEGLLGTTAQKYRFENLFGSKNTLLIDDYKYAYLDMATNQESAITAGGMDHVALLSWFGRLNYNYNNKYMATVILRVDGSSKFGDRNKYGYFPSVSLGWNISEEPFLADNDIIDYLKIRAGWGRNGSDNIDNFAYISTLSSFYRYTFGDDPVIYPGSAPERIANPELRWETTEQINLGFNLNAFSNRFSLIADFYNKKTYDILIPGVPIPSIAGNNPPASNAGDVLNRGIELEMGFTDRIGNLSYKVSLNGAYNQNKMTFIGNQEKVLNGAGVATAMPDVTRAMEGYPIGFFYGYVILGIFDSATEVNEYTNEVGKIIQPQAKPGDFKFKDKDGNGIINTLDKEMIGDPNPDFTFGLNGSVEYRSFDLNLFVQGVAGNQIFNGTRRYDLPASNWEASVLDRWTGAGTSDSYPRLTISDPNGNYSKASSFYIEDGSYLRLKNITLGYTLPALSVADYNISSIRIYFTAQNLLTLTGYKGFDPEIGSADWVFNTGIDRGIYPQARTLLIGANIVF
ncbi:MAG: SusC/RagA family TonB-linked outer membrane protein [Bacteroidales bacterium]